MGASQVVAKHQAKLAEAQLLAGILQPDLVANQRIAEESEAIAAAEYEDEDSRYAGWNYYQGSAWDREEDHA